MLKVGKTVKSKEADYVVESVHNLVQVIPEIWMNTADSDGDDEMMNRSRNEVDSIHMTAAAAVGA